MTTSTVIKYNPYDLLTAIGTEVVESHLRLVYSDESLYIDALAAAAVRAVEPRGRFLLTPRASFLPALSISTLPESGLLLTPPSTT
jgi:hypothetical protein